MKKILLLCCLLFVGIAHSQVNYFENDVRFLNSESQTTLTHYGELPITEKFGITDYVFVTNGSSLGSWGEVVIGPYYKPTKSTLIGVYAGIETGTKKARFAVIGSWNITERLVGYIFYEYGQGYTNNGPVGADDYYDYHLKYEAYKGTSTSLYASLRFRQGYGIGVPLGGKTEIVKGSKKYVHLYYTTFYNSDKTIVTTGSNWIPTISLNLDL